MVAKRFLYLLFFVLPVSSVFAAGGVNGVTTPYIDDDRPDRGWFFYEIYPEVKKEKILTEMPPEQQPSNKVEECMHRDHWTPECGFVIPRSIEFTERQYKELSANMALNANNTEAVFEFQRFNKWVVDQAVTLSNTWAYNSAQNPEELGSGGMAVSNFGRRILGSVNRAKRQDLFESLAETSTLYYFTRSDCVYCVEMVPVVNDIQRETGMNIWNVSLDEMVIEGFENNVAAPESLPVAEMLGIEMVPTLFIHMPPDQWIRVTTGIDTTDMVLSRIVNFVEAYRSALLKGMSEGEELQPDFSNSGPYKYGRDEMDRYRTTDQGA